MTIEINFGLEKLFYFHASSCLKHHFQLSNMVVSFEDNKYNTKDIYLFEVFLYVYMFKLLLLCESINNIYHTAQLYDFLQHPVAL